MSDVEPARVESFEEAREQSKQLPIPIWTRESTGFTVCGSLAEKRPDSCELSNAYNNNTNDENHIENHKETA